MHRMTRPGDAPDAATPFDGRTMRFHDSTVTLSSRSGRRYVRIDHAVGAGAGARAREPETFLVTRVIGGRTREDFAGLRVGEVGDAAGTGDETVLPVSYLIFSGKLRYKGYSVLVHERPDPRPGPVWSRTCVFCHNTIASSKDPFDGKGGATMADLVEVGIGCEACHGGARAHAEDPSSPPRFPPPLPSLTSPLPPPKNDGEARAQAINQVCERCHHVLFTRYPWTWEGKRRASPDRGGSVVNSGEARDFLLGGCANALACTACHDPHDATDRAAKDDALATAAGNAVCTRCHGEFSSDAQLRAHAHHDPKGPGGACVACHMPKKNMGLDVRLTRYHRIGSPTDPERVLLDRPLECALCHADKSVESLVSTMERWWNKAYVRDLLTRLYGDLSSPVLLSTLLRGKPHERAVAASVLGETHDRRYAAPIAGELASEYPLIRAFAARALTGALGRDCALGVETEDVPHLEAEASRCFAAAGLPSPVFPRATAASASGEAESPED
jgi:predicted CXXCH cytochrome family protein